MLKEGAPSASSPAEPSEVPARRVTDAGRKPSVMKTEEILLPAAAEEAPVEKGAQRGAVGKNHERVEHREPREPHGDDGRSKRQRMTAAARDVVEEKLSPRVEKLRHASNVMLEEAAYDPSLRFILVAIAIIIISLLLLLLNYLLG